MSKQLGTVGRAGAPGYKVPSLPFRTCFAPEAPPCPIGEVSSVDLAPETFQVQLNNESSDADKGSVDVVWYTGATVYRSGGFFGEPYNLILSMDPAHIRTERLFSDRMVVLDSHGPDFGNPGIEHILGRLTNARIENGQGLGTIIFSVNEAGQNARKMAEHGDLNNLSIGLKVHSLRDVSAPGDDIPTLLADDWEPDELSFLPIGADSGAHTFSKENKNPCKVSRLNSDPLATPSEPTMFLTRQQVLTLASESGLSAEFAEIIFASGKLGKDDVTAAIASEVARLAAAAPPEPTASPAGGSPAAGASLVELAAAREAGAVAERVRRTEILSRVAAAGMTLAYGESLIDQSLSVQDAADQIFEQLSNRQDGEGDGGQVSPWQINREEGEGETLAVQTALQHRFNPGAVELNDHARQFRGLTLIELAVARAQRFGIKTVGLTRAERAQLAFHSTSDFPSILSNIASHSLRAGYEEAPKTFESLSRRVTLPDFKNVERAQLGEAPILELVGESGEVRSGTVGEGKETYALQTYAKNFKITRKTIINDDLDAFSRMPQLFGTAAAALENTLAWALLTTGADGVTMGDALALFAAGHSNTGTGVLGVAGLGTCRTSFRNQTGLSGRPLNLTMRNLMVPAALETAANQLVGQNLNPNTPSDVNPFNSSIKGVIVEPLLDLDSVLKWYGAAEPGAIDIFEHAYLDGQNGPMVESYADNETLGMTIRAVEDFAIAVIDHRGLYRSTGA